MIGKRLRRAAGDGPRTSALSCSINGFEDFSESLQPGDISLLGVFLNTFQPLYRLGLVAWLAGVVWGNHHLNLYSHDVAIGVNPLRCLDTLARNLHGVYYYRRCIGAPDFSSESAGIGLTSLRRKRRAFETAYHALPFACASGLLQAGASGSPRTGPCYQCMSKCWRSCERAGLIPVLDMRMKVTNSTTSATWPKSASICSSAAGRGRPSR